MYVSVIPIQMFIKKLAAVHQAAHNFMIYQQKKAARIRQFGTDNLGGWDNNYTAMFSYRVS